MHNGFIDEANQVQFARTLTLEQNLTTEFGIKGIPLLSSLSSLLFPASFPYDFMHLYGKISFRILFYSGQDVSRSCLMKGWVMSCLIQCGQISAAFLLKLEIQFLRHLVVMFPTCQLNVGNSQLKAGPSGQYTLHRSCFMDDFPKKNITNIFSI